MVVYGYLTRLTCLFLDEKVKQTAMQNALWNTPSAVSIRCKIKRRKQLRKTKSHSYTLLYKPSENTQKHVIMSQRSLNHFSNKQNTEEKWGNKTVSYRVFFQVGLVFFVCPRDFTWVSINDPQHYINIISIPSILQSLTRKINAQYEKKHI